MFSRRSPAAGGARRLRHAALALLAGAALGILAGADVAPPVPITIHATTMPGDQFAAISTAAKVNFIFAPERIWTDPRNNWAPVKLNFDQKTFWEATRELCRAAGLTTNVNDARADRIRIWKVRSTSEFDGPFVSQGPFLVVLNSIQHNRGAGTFATVEGRAFVDPGTNVYAYTPGIDVTSISDDKKTAIEAAAARLTPAARPLHPMILPLLTTLKTTADLGVKASVKGSLRFIVATSTESTSISDVLQATFPVTKNLGGMTIQLDEATRFNAEKATEDRIKISLTVHRGTYPKALWDAMAAKRYAYLQVSVADRGNRALAAPDVLPANPARITITPSTATDPDTFTYRYEFPLSVISDADGTTFQPSRLVMDVATAVKEVTVPLNLNDIPIMTAPY